MSRATKCRYALNGISNLSGTVPSEVGIINEFGDLDPVEVGFDGQLK